MPSSLIARRLALVALVLATPLATLPAQSTGYHTTSQVPVVRGDFEALYSGLHARLYAGEHILATARGEICVGHVHRTERRGGFLGIGRKNVTIDHHTLYTASQRPPSFRLTVLDDGDQTPPAQTGTSASFVVPSTRLAGARTSARLDAFIPNADPRHHLGYAVEVSINSQGRLPVLQAALAQRGWTKAEVDRSDFFSERLRQQYPEQLAEMLVTHAADKWAGDVAERKRLLEFALTLAPNSTPVLVGLGNVYLDGGDYPAAQVALMAALRANRQAFPKNYKSWGDAALGLAETYFQQNMALTPSDLSEARQLLGEAIKAYASATVPLRAEERKAQVRLAEVLSRIRTVEALRGAAQAYVRARELGS